MQEHFPKFIIIGLLIAIIGVPILLRPADGNDADSADAQRLVVYTPHNEQIRHEVETAYNNWRADNDMAPVVFDWRTPGGTSDIRKGIISQFGARIKNDESLDRGIGVDLFFGGGAYDHNIIAEGIDKKFRLALDPQIDPVLFKQAFPNDTIGGEPLYNRRTFVEDGETVEIIAWTGVTLSSFGIVYNNDSLKQLGIAQPQTWRDLGDPQLLGWVALADPGHSSSIAATFETILRREGWGQGWRTLRRVYANARYFATSSDRVPVDVSRGDAAVGMCIDFYGRYQAGAIGKDRVGYVDPIENDQSMTATTADPITLLRGAPNPDLARDFIAWLLTPDAQVLWQRAKSDTADGLVRPDRYELRRQPIRADLYTDEQRASWVDQQLNPFPTAVPFPEGTPGYFSLVAPITRAMAAEIHHDIRKAWVALNDAKEAGHPNLAEMETLFYAMPPELTIAWPDKPLEQDWRKIHYDPEHPRYQEVVDTLVAFKDQLRKLYSKENPELIESNRIKWREFFQANYAEVVRLGKQ